ncbi:MAG: hypothetical protein MR380_01920 [Lachnospiraceae bacterium]|nr:hypothetical protein [Lachnospiraceae bacterium]
MAKGQSIVSINRTRATVIGGMIFISLLSSGTNNLTVSANCLHKTKEKTLESNCVEINKSYTIVNGMNYILSGYNIHELSDSGVDGLIINKDKIYNLKKLDQIALLKDGWNGKNAKSFKEEFISKVRSIITALEIQPELFPTASNSIQIEYEKEDGSYLEIELNTKSVWEVFEIDCTGDEKYFSISADLEAIAKVVNSFYG